MKDIKVQKSDFKLIFRLLIGITIGVCMGLLARKSYVDPSVYSGFSLKSSGNFLIQIIGSIKHICGQFIFYVVPLVIIGFIAPAITKLGKNASKMLIYTLLIAYVSSVGAAFFATFFGYSIVPFLVWQNETSSLIKLPDLIFKFDIPALMSVMTALVTAIAVGITALFTKAKTFELLLNELEKMVSMLISYFIIPILPLFVACTFAQLAFEGNLTTHLPVFIGIILIAILGHLIWLTLLYSIGALVSKKNPFEVIKYYGPAYLTAVGTMSSSATLPVALSCARKSPVLSKNTIDFVIPLCATIHLCGSVLTETLFCISIIYAYTGALPAIGTMVVFAVLLGVFAIGAPGVPGGTVVASLGIVTSVLGFNDQQIGFLLAIFALQDSFGTACNVTGDGAIAMMIDGVFKDSDNELLKE